MIPYTYHLYHKLTNKHYYGVRWSKNCCPTELWVTYFSSSKKVKNLIKTYGKESFDFEIRKIFKSSDQAIQWEAKVLRRLKVLSNENWLNQNINGAIVYDIHPLKGKTRPEHIRQAISKARKESKGKYCWIFNEHSEKRILINDIDEFLSSGWYKGRSKKMKDHFSNFAKTRTGDKNPFYGKKHTTENRKKHSKFMKGNKFRLRQSVDI